MKILWFCNTPCCALEKISKEKTISGGWLNTMSTELAKISDIELHIAFYWTQNIKPFCYQKIYYHPIYIRSANNKFSRWIKRVKCIQFPSKEDITPLINITSSIKPDLIHVHGTEENFGLIALQIKNIPIVISIQGFISSIHAKLFSGIPQDKVRIYESLLDKISYKGERTIEKVLNHKRTREKMILSHTKYIIGRTDFDRFCSLVYNPFRTYYKVNEIMREVFFKHQWIKENSSSPLIITTTIRDGLYKGLEVIYLTSKLLKQSHFNFSWQVIGITENSNYVALVEKYTKLKANDLGINFLGRQDAYSLCNILLNSDLYCQTSHIENSSNSTCEAMALGMPIIASFAGGTSSLIINNKTGILVQDGDPYSLGGAIIELSNSFIHAQKLGNEARKYAMQNLSPNNAVKELLFVYDQVNNDFL